MVPDAEVDEPQFKQALLELVDDGQAREAMHEAAAAFGTRDAAAKLADVVIATGRKVRGDTMRDQPAVDS